MIDASDQYALKASCNQVETAFVADLGNRAATEKQCGVHERSWRPAPRTGGEANEARGADIL